MKIFYTTYEGGQILEKNLRRRISLEKLSIFLTGLSDGIRLSDDHIKDVKLPGIRSRVHSIFIPVPPSPQYQRWDSVNGWNELESRDTLARLTKAMGYNKQKRRKRK